jgi:DNA sulfur modification protein DndD
MFLRRLTLRNYGIFENADFDLATDVDHPIVLISGNNGAGKTSILEAIRVALHGRRAFDVPLGENEYLRAMARRLHLRSGATDWGVSLEFDHVDLHKTKHVAVDRTWTQRGQRIAESVTVTQDKLTLPSDVADDLLATIVPPEIARYFFFDGERIRELADWDEEEASVLFNAASDLLGLGVLDQLRADVLRLTAIKGKHNRDTDDATAKLEHAEQEAAFIVDDLRKAKVLTRGIRGAVDRARADVRRVGAIQQEEVAALHTELAELAAERRVLNEEAQRAAADILPLLCARTLRQRFTKDIEARRRLEDRETVTAFLERHEPQISVALRTQGLKAAANRRALQAIFEIARGPLVAVSVSLPNLSRSDAAWMRRVIEHELPEMDARSQAMVTRLRVLDEKLASLEDRRRSIPVNDPAGEVALVELENVQRVLLEHEATLQHLEERRLLANKALELARDAAKAQRVEAFGQGRLRDRDRVMNHVLQALPTLADRLKTVKELRFAEYLEAALHELWNKTERLSGVDISFAERRIALLGPFGEIPKRDLSAGEKQLFATAFIYALAKLSGRLMPFVIDTPLGRLDRSHRRRFVAEFLPNASHQIILLSTDTEIVGPLYEDMRSLLAHHHELAAYNGGATEPVAVATA